MIVRFSDIKLLNCPSNEETVAEQTVESRCNVTLF